ncbi:MAG: precorrin-4 C(11)-methyltransferase [Deltaproteobacteria bacterium]|jgi:precorrin-4/cobalt-precorrin-4 C11-methyltransferase|nr:precorrin-4 C(11)-methyltransferase [Deltaproteobacteria bacterium]
MDKPNNPVIFVGAGPGDPGLITVSGSKALAAADLIVTAGSLVNPEILAYKKDGCEVVDSAPLDLSAITDILAEGHRKGRKVVRLHTGDPSLYGAIYEQFLVLRERGVPYEVIPGVTAAMAGAAALGLEYTLPEITQTLILTRMEGRTPMPQGEDLRSLAAHRASLALYLSAAVGGEVSAILQEAYGEDAPVAILYRVTWKDQRIIWTTAKGLPKTLADEKLDRHSLIITGPALAALKDGGNTPKSRLYAKEFTHGFRDGEDGGPA